MNERKELPSTDFPEYTDYITNRAGSSLIPPSQTHSKRSRFQPQTATSKKPPGARSLITPSIQSPIRLWAAAELDQSTGTRLLIGFGDHHQCAGKSASCLGFYEEGALLEVQKVPPPRSMEGRRRTSTDVGHTCQSNPTISNDSNDSHPLPACFTFGCLPLLPTSTASIVLSSINPACSSPM